MDSPRLERSVDIKTRPGLGTAKAEAIASRARPRPRSGPTERISPVWSAIPAKLGVCPNGRRG